MSLPVIPFVPHLSHFVPIPPLPSCLPPRLSSRRFLSLHPPLLPPARSEPATTGKNFIPLTCRERSHLSFCISLWAREPSRARGVVLSGDSVSRVGRRTQNSCHVTLSSASTTVGASCSFWCETNVADPRATELSMALSLLAKGAS